MWKELIFLHLTLIIKCSYNFLLQSIALKKLCEHSSVIYLRFSIFISIKRIQYQIYITLKGTTCIQKFLKAVNCNNFLKMPRKILPNSCFYPKIIV